MLEDNAIGLAQWIACGGAWLQPRDGKLWSEIESDSESPSESESESASVSVSERLSRVHDMPASQCVTSCHFYHIRGIIRILPHGTGLFNAVVVRWRQAGIYTNLLIQIAKIFDRILRP